MTSTKHVQFNLAGKRALVTGSASGIGFATAALLARSGARVAMNDVSADRLRPAVERLAADGLAVTGVAGDLGVADAAREVGCRAVDALGGLEFLVNNAGAPCTRVPIPPADLDALTDEFWDKILKVNLLSAFWVTRSVSAALRESRGAVVNTASIAAFGGGASSTAYAAAKAGLVGLTRELARGLAPDVRVNAIAPGLVNSPWECSFGNLDAMAQQTVPLGRVGEPDDYAEVIAYLCAGASYMTGQVVQVTGGLLL
jgi:3-oxoacyl-[acyl-carrier protein] reductase